MRPATCGAYAYDAWRRLMNTSGSLAGTLGVDNPYRYRGYRFDTETGLYYLQSRYYNPHWGRFVNADGQLNPNNGLIGFNKYAYCANNPVNQYDINGCSGTTTALVCVGIALLCVAVIVFAPVVAVVAAGTGIIVASSTIASGAAYIGVTSLALGTIALIEENPIEFDIPLPNQGNVSEIPDAPPVDAGAQGKHVSGHNNNDAKKKHWPEGENGVKDTQEAWVNGKPVNPDGSVRIGISSRGINVKVHFKPSKGTIHGYPYAGSK